VARKIWLSQTGHVDPFDYRRAAWVSTLHQWFDHWLQGLPNGVMHEPVATVERPSGRWVTGTDWPATAATTRIALSRWGGTGLRRVTDDPALLERVAVAQPGREITGRAMFLGPARRTPLHVAGTPSVTLRIRVNRPDTELTARLVDYGEQRRVNAQSPGEGIVTGPAETCWGQSTSADDACYHVTRQVYVTSGIDVVTRGWLDAAHHRSLRMRTPLQSGRWYSITVPLNATDTVIAAGHRIGVVITLSDLTETAPRTEGATIRIDPTRSVLRLPHA
jgi:X-Pro dipeptidyl-peptidase